MKQILLFGAGRSATHFIEYTLKAAALNNWHLTIAEADEALALSKLKGHPSGRVVSCMIEDPAQRRRLISQADIVVSMLPAALHILVAHDCVALKKDLATASYVSDEMKILHPAAVINGVTLMNELGLDPGLDHMSAMKVMHEIKAQGGTVNSFESYCGGLVAPGSDDNPWHYKISWNPRNIVQAGSGTAVLLENGKIRCVPHSRLFREAKQIAVPGAGTWSMYYNRDSLKYKELYKLNEAHTMIRGTFRHPDFNDAWALVVALGLIDNTIHLENSNELSYRDFTSGYFSADTGNLKNSLDQTIGYRSLEKHFEMLDWLGLFSDELIGIPDASPVDIMERLVISKWKLAPEDADLVLMHHKIGYTIDGKQHWCTSTLNHTGKDAVHTAMSELVGLPLAIYVKNRLSSGNSIAGVHIPLAAEIYNPILAELAEAGIQFVENWGIHA